MLFLLLAGGVPEVGRRSAHVVDIALEFGVPGEPLHLESVTVPSFEAVVSDKRDYALATKIEYEEHDPIRGKAILQRHGDRTNPSTSRTTLS